MLGILYIAMIIWGAITAISVFALLAIYTHHELMERQRGRVIASAPPVKAPKGASLA